MTQRSRLPLPLLNGFPPYRTKMVNHGHLDVARIIARERGDAGYVHIIGRVAACIGSDDAIGVAYWRAVGLLFHQLLIEQYIACDDRDPADQMTAVSAAHGGSTAPAR